MQMRRQCVVLAMSQQEAQQMLARLAQIAHCLRTQRYQVAHRFVHLVWHPDLGQLTRPQRLNQCHRVTPIGLHPVARSVWNQRCCHHVTTMPELSRPPPHPIAAGPGLVTIMQPLPALRQLPTQRPQRVRHVLDRPVKPNLGSCSALRNRHRDRLLVHIQTDK
jgi:hypothetical protein